MNTLQQYAYDLAVNNRKNIFITAAGGAGKSYLIKKIFMDMSPRFNIGMTSMTGISANLLNGKTLHSYLGIGLGTDSFENLFHKINNWKFMKNRWCRLDALIIDEVSMMDDELFEKLEHLARTIRECNKPFGGIQLIISGDFLQLPNVGTGRFCFESPIWKVCIDKTILLREIMRQRDPQFVSILNKIRTNNIDDECKKIIESRCIKYKNTSGILPTKLYSTNALVDLVNSKYYTALETPEHTYEILYKWKKKVRNQEYYEELVKLPYKLKLKIGSQVMHLTNNNDLDLFNGSRGVVIDFVEDMPKVLFAKATHIISPVCLDVLDEDTNIPVMSYKQIPLKLAWAMTIHKSQGSTLDLVKINFERIFEYGQFYVALSRCTSLDGLYLYNLDWNLIKAHPKALEYYRELEHNSYALV